MIRLYDWRSWSRYVLKTHEDEPHSKLPYKKTTSWFLRFANFQTRLCLLIIYFERGQFALYILRPFANQIVCYHACANLTECSKPSLGKSISKVWARAISPMYTRTTKSSKAHYACSSHACAYLTGCLYACANQTRCSQPSLGGSVSNMPEYRCYSAEGS